MTCTALAASLAALAVLALPPQDENRAPTSRPNRPDRSLIADARLLPPQTIALARLAPLDPHDAELDKLTLVRALRDLELPAPVATQTHQVLSRIREQLGLDQKQLGRLIRNGLVVAITPAEQGDGPGFVVILDPKGSGDALTPECLAKLVERAGGTVRSERAGDTAFHVLQLAGSQALYLSKVQDRLVLATSVAGITPSTSSVHGNASSLADVPRFRSWTETLEKEDDSIFTLWLDLRELATRTVRGVATKGGNPIAALGSFLKLEALGSLSLTIQAREGELHDCLRIELAGPRSPLVTALLGEGCRLRPGLANLIPASSTSWSIHNLDLVQAFQEGTQLFGALAPDDARAFDQALQALQQKLGVDFLRDVLGNLGTEFLVLGLGTDTKRIDTGSDFALLVPVHNPTRLTDAFTKLAQNYGVRTSSGMVGNKRILRFALPGLPADAAPALHVGQTHLVVATSHTLLERVLVQLAEAPENRRVQEFLASLPANATAAVWADPRSAIRTHWDRFASYAGSTLKLPQELAQVRGSMRALMTLDEGGVTWRCSSPIGDMTLVGLVATVLEQAAPSFLETKVASILELGSRAGSTGHPSVPPIAELVAGITRAQIQYKTTKKGNRPGAPRAYGTLGDLVAEGLVEAARLGTRVDEQTWEVHGHRISILLPSQPAERERHFATVAWPADKRTGTVWCGTASKPCMSNDLIARSLGIATIDARDVWVDGAFGGQLSTGWRDVAVGPDAAQKSPQPSASQDLVSALDLLEKAGKSGKGSIDLLLALDHPNADLRARAAYLAGKLQISDAAPKLCAIVIKEPDELAGRQAMAALAALADPRGRQAAISALACQSAETRAAAAALLGKLKAKDAVESLVTMLATSATGTGDDKVQALTALADIGATQGLLAAASGARTNDKQVGAALTYLFQTLSKKLPKPEEVKVLMAVLEHPSDLLRRFAIQRLGELKDPIAVAALESRLANESQSLQPLVRVSLDAIVGTKAGTKQANPASALLEKATAFWERQTPTQRITLAAILAAFVLLAFLSVMLVVKVRRNREAELWASKVTPSEGFVSEQPEEELPYEPGPPSHQAKQRFSGDLQSVGGSRPSSPGPRGKR